MTSGTYDFIINRASGTIMKKGIDQVHRDLADIFGSAATVTFVEPGEVDKAVEQWTMDRVDGRRLVIGGGDGSISTAAAKAIETGTPLGILPVGTLNYTALETGFAPDYRKAAIQLKNAVPRTIDTGCVNGMTFLRTVHLSPAVVDMFRQREKVRGQASLARRFALAASFIGNLITRENDTIRYNIGGPDTEELPAKILIITCNPLTPERSRNPSPLWQNLKDVARNAFAMNNRNEGRLALYAYNGDLEMLRVPPSLWRGTWEKTPGLKIVKTPALTIEAADFATPGGDVTFVLDGETRTARLPLNIEVRPNSLQLYVPASFS